MPKKRSFKRHPVTQPPHNFYRIIPLTQGLHALVDPEDFIWLSRWNWGAHESNGVIYAARGRKYKNRQTSRVYMHRQILSCSASDKEVDHKNHNTLDNRKANLRKCTRAQNMRNTRLKPNMSGVRGIFRHYNKWVARIGKRTNLGSFDTLEEAIRVRKAAEKELFGEFLSSD